MTFLIESSSVYSRFDPYGRESRNCKEDRITMDWRDPNSTDEKRRLIEEHYGDIVPGYLLFHLGTITRLTDEEEQQLNDLFFDGRQPGFGDKEMHGSHGYTGSYLQHAPGQRELAPFIVLRIRDARKMHYAITLRGEERPLLQVTNGDSTKPIINFMERWGLSPQDIRA